MLTYRPATPKRASPGDRMHNAIPRLIPPLARYLVVWAALLVAIALAPSLAVAAGGVDDLRVRQLEQDIMRLQRELDAQNRRLDTLERTQRTASPSPPIVAAAPRAADSSPAWLIGTNWDRVRPGMKEIDVIALLGRPTSVRPGDDGKSRAFFYAMELGPNAILSGSIQLGDTGVTEVNRPVLR